MPLPLLIIPVAAAGIIIAGAAVVGVGTVAVVGVGAVAVVGTGAVCVGANEGRKKYKKHKKVKKAKNKRRVKTLKGQLKEKYPELFTSPVPKIPKDTGSTIPLDGFAGYNIGLGWDSKRNQETNADLIGVIYDKDYNLLQVVSGEESKKYFATPAIVHTGDCRKGGDDSKDEGEYGDNENIIINFSALPENVGSIIIASIFDKNEDGKLRFSDGYLHGSPITQFITAEELVLKQQSYDIENQKRIEDMLKKDTDNFESDSEFDDNSFISDGGTEFEDDTTLKMSVDNKSYRYVGQSTKDNNIMGTYLAEVRFYPEDKKISMIIGYTKIHDNSVDSYSCEKELKWDPSLGTFEEEDNWKGSCKAPKHSFEIENKYNDSITLNYSPVDFDFAIKPHLYHNALIAGKFSNISGYWAYEPIRLPVAADSIDDLVKITQDFKTSSLAVRGWGHRTFKIELKDIPLDDYILTCITFDRWNYRTIHVDVNDNIFTPGFDTFIVLQWNSNPRPFTYSIGTIEDGKKQGSILCNNVTNTDYQLLCRISRSRPHQRESYTLPCSKDCFLDFINAKLEIPSRSPQELAESIRTQYNIGEPITGVAVTIKRGFDLAVKDITGSSDPYVKTTLKKKKYSSFKDKTKVINSNLNPEWNHTLIVHPNVIDESSLIFSVYDHDSVGGDDKIGSCSVNFSKLAIPSRSIKILKGKGVPGAIQINSEVLCEKNIPLTFKWKKK